MTKGLNANFKTFLPIGTRQIKVSKEQNSKVFFKKFSLGISTNRDIIVYDFNKFKLQERVEQFCDDYNAELKRYENKGKPQDIDNFVNYEKIKWSSTLKNHLKYGHLATFNKTQIRICLYRPYTYKYLYFDNILIDMRALFGIIFPSSNRELDNQTICTPGIGNRTDFGCLISNQIVSLDLGFEKTQCFPFYIYSKDGITRQENITDWCRFSG